MTEMTGGEAMVLSAIEHGVDTVFGLPGVQMYPLFDALARREADVRLIGSRHEQGVAYMAFGYARASGKPGVFSVVPGPGVLNATAALSTAWACNAPVMCLTGQIPSPYLDDNYQGMRWGHLHEIPDQLGVLKSLTKFAAHIETPGDTPAVMQQAFSQMMGGRQGPVAVEMCWDTMARRADIDAFPTADPLAPPEVDPDAVASAVKLAADAKKPMIFVGGGALHAQEEVLALAEALGAPVTALRGGRGVVPEDHDLFVSSVAALDLWPETDLVIGIGSRLELPFMRWRSDAHPDNPTGEPPLIRIEIEEAEMKRLAPTVGILADAKSGARELGDAIAAKRPNSPDNSERIAAAKAGAEARLEELQPQKGYLDAIRDVLPRDGHFVGELCQVGYISYFGLPVYEPRTYHMPGYQGTLGYGFPTSLGVKAARPDKAVVSVNGDGGFMFGVQELATAVQEKLGVVAIVFNNQAFGNVRRDQQVRYGRVSGADLKNPDFVALAESFGAAGYRVVDAKSLRATLEKALADDAPAVIEAVIEPDIEPSPWELIYPGRK